MPKGSSNHANQCNPNNASYQGHTSSYSGSGTRSDLNNHSNQMNPTSSTYSSSRGGNNYSSGNKKWRINEVWFYIKSFFVFFNNIFFYFIIPFTYQFIFI